jgi:ATP-dependent Clp protease protease subunit
MNEKNTENYMTSRKQSGGSGVIFANGIWSLPPGSRLLSAQRRQPGGAELLRRLLLESQDIGGASPSTTFVPRVRVNNEALDMYTFLMEQGMIKVTGTIDETTYDQVTGQLQILANVLPIRKKTGIRMYINSGGGVVSDGLAIYDCMVNLGKDVTTIVSGMAASMAAVLLAAGTKGKRLAQPHARIMIHQPRVGGSGRQDGTEMDISNAEMQQCKGTLIEILALHSGKSTAEVRQDVERDRWMSVEEAMHYGPFGIVDRVLTPADFASRPEEPEDE